MSPEGQVQGIAQHIVEFVRANEMWAAPIVGVLAFGESLAFISLALPAWAVLVALGALISQGGISFWPVWVAGAVGAGLGDWLSYWIGTKLWPAVGDIWPLSRHPDLRVVNDLLPNGACSPSSSAGFSGPLRAVVPLVAGIFAMPFWRFQIANFVSAFVWVAMLLTLGDVVVKSFKLIWR
jgi:membrane protein DedA with SNARE-associated domain